MRVQKSKNMYANQEQLFIWGVYFLFFNNLQVIIVSLSWCMHQVKENRIWKKSIEIHFLKICYKKRKYRKMISGQLLILSVDL